MNKEQIYDDQVAPLMTKILQVCQQNGIAMIASFDISHEADPSLRCTSQLPDGDGKFPFARVAGLLMATRLTPHRTLRERTNMKIHSEVLAVETIGDALRVTLQCCAPEDAKLIAAAPELLEALRELLSQEKLDDGDPRLERARAAAAEAITKATT